MDFIGRALMEKYEKIYRDSPDVVKLIQRLMEIQTGEFVQECGIDPFATKIRIRGHIYSDTQFPVDVISTDLPRGQCHHYAATVNKMKPSMRIVTGYGYYDGQWYRHSWLLDSKKNRIVDIDTRAQIYFGYELSNGESKMFYDYFFREGIFADVP